MLALNVRAPFFLAQAAAPHLRDARGAIVNIADLAAFETWPAYVPHGISKAGVVQLTRSLARVLAPDVRVTAIAPGAVLLPEELERRRTRSICATTTPLARAWAVPRTSRAPSCSSSTRTTSPARRSSSTAAGMSAADARATPQTVTATIVVVGGGCYGSYYVRQLGRARAAPARSTRNAWSSSTATRRARGATRSPSERVAAARRARRRASGATFFDDYLAAAAARSVDDARRRDRAVAAHAASHGRVARRRARASVGRTASSDATARRRARRALAARRRRRHALRQLREWMCPINCIEPRICPHTRDARTGACPSACASTRTRERDAGDAESRSCFTAAIARTASGCSTSRDVVDADARSRAAGSAARRERHHRNGVALPWRADASGRSADARRERLDSIVGLDSDEHCDASRAG